MANSIKGEVDFPVGDKTYRLRLSINEIIQVEDLLGIGIIKIAGMFNDVESLTAGSVRAVLWGALREHPSPTHAKNGRRVPAADPRTQWPRLAGLADS